MDLTPEEHARIYEEEKARREEQPAFRAEAEARFAPQRRSTNWKAIVLGLVALAIPLLFVHIVYGFAEEPLVILMKDQPGFADTFVSAESLVGIPKIVLLAQHSSVIKGLEKRGLLKWESQVDLPKDPPFSLQEQEQEANLILDKYDWKWEDSILYIVGTVRNDSQVACGYGQISFRLLDKSGNQVGTATDNVTELAPGGTWRFKCLVFDHDDVKSCELIEVKAGF